MKPLHALIPTAFASLALVACASNPGVTRGANPYDMSVAHHEAAAQQEEHAAVLQEAKYDPDATVSTTRCRADPFGQNNCWESVENPTEKYREQAALHRKRAKDHLAAAVALLAAEQEACAGLPPETGATGPLTAESVASVQLLAGEGAAIRLRSDPQVSVAKLEQAVACHRAHMASLGFVGASMKDCPLALEKADTDVSSSEGGPIVTVTAEDPKVARAIIARAQALAQHDASSGR
jgi:hypothetical protein